MPASSLHRSEVDRGEIEGYIATRPAAELTVARSAVRRMIVVGPLLLLAFGLSRGLDGLVASSLGLAIVAAYYLLSGAMLSTAARISLGAYHAAALIGFFVRMALIAGSMFALAALFEIDRLAIGLTVVVAYLVLLGWEAATIAGAGRDRQQGKNEGEVA